MESADIAQALEVPVSMVNEWIAQGMHLDSVEEAEEWLVANGLASYEEEPAPAPIKVERDVLKSRAAIAMMMNLNPVKVGVFVSQADFPTGPPWDKEAVLEWFSKREIEVGVSTKEERDRIKLEIEKLQLSKEKREVISLEEVIVEMTRQHSLAVAKLKGLVNLLVGLLPADTPPMVVSDFRKRAQKTIADACDDIATAFRGEVEDEYLGNFTVTQGPRRPSVGLSHSKNDLGSPRRVLSVKSRNRSGPGSLRPCQQPLLA